MATNSYFQSSYMGAGEQSLAEDLIIEAIQIHGRDMYYIPREYAALDKLYGEDKLSAFTQAYLLEFYIKNVQQFGGDSEFISKFGLEVRDEIDLTVARRRFADEITLSDESIIRPREGDLIMFPLDQRLFEISFVEDKEVFFQLGTLFTYELRCRLFDLGAEKFSTGIEEIDAIAESQYTKRLELVSGSGDFIVGETIFQGTTFQTATFKATVLSWNSPVLIVQRTAGLESETLSVQGLDSLAEWTFDSDLTEDSNSRPTMNDRENLKGGVPAALDTSESNPQTGF